jgi:hypothetical protein
MTRLLLSSALKEISSRNAAIAASYRDWAKRLPPGPVSKLASSMAGQRLDLGKTLGEISADPSLVEMNVEFDSDPRSLAVWEPSGGGRLEPKELLEKMAEAEAADHELLAAFAGAFLPASLAIAERLASEANSARKRSTWAQDHLDLLRMG